MTFSSGSSSSAVSGQKWHSPENTIGTTLGQRRSLCTNIVAILVERLGFAEPRWFIEVLVNLPIYIYRDYAPRYPPKV